MKYEGAILAGGIGARIRPMSLTIPKPMLPVLNVPLIERQLACMEKSGIERICVVVGSMKDSIVRHIGKRKGAAIEVVEQKSPVGIAHAAGLLERRISGPFFLFLGDIFYESLDLGDMKKLFESPGCDGVVAVNREPREEYIRRNFTVHLNGGSRIVKVREKPERPDTDLKGCGIYLFGPKIFDAIGRTPKNGKRGEYELTTAIQIMIDSGGSMLAGRGPVGDINITGPEDLLESNLRALRAENRSSVIGKGADIHPGAVVENSVIGSSVRITEPVKITGCVIMEGVTYDDSTDLSRSIVMKDYIFQAGPEQTAG